MRLAGLLLAAGRGRRFGANKLEAELHGKLLGRHAAEVLASVVTGDLYAVCNLESALLREELTALGFRLIDNDAPEAGLSRSLSLGLSGVGPADAVLLCLADMPFITASHLHELITRSEGGQTAIASCLNGQHMPPALLPRQLWPADGTLHGDVGARQILAQANCVEAAAALLADIDRPGDLPR